MRRFNKKILITLLLCVSLVFINVKAVGNNFQIVFYDRQGNLFSTDKNFISFEEANTFRKQQEKSLDKNFGVMKNGVLLAVDYGIVNLTTGYNAVFQATEVTTGDGRYLAGSYAADAAFIDAVDENTWKVKIAGALIKIAHQGATLMPFSMNTSESYNPRKHIYQNISMFKFTPTTIDYYLSTSLELTQKYKDASFPKPKHLNKLSQNSWYYSYDGHYFYDDFKKMIDDYRNENYNQASNKEPYYNYYMYLPFHSLTNYTTPEIVKYMKDVVYPRASNSVLIGHEDAFLKAQEDSNINAISTLSVARNESANGTSYYARERYNLFGIRAYDSDPNQATDFKEIARRKNTDPVFECIYYFMHTFISYGYLDHTDFRYYGGFLGNKNSGINVKYASDPFWGIKAAKFYADLDSYLGLKDYRSYKIGIMNSNANQVRLNTAPTQNSVTLLLNKKSSELSFIILGEENGYYKVLLDSPLNNNRDRFRSVEAADYANFNYNFDRDYAYLPKSNINYVIESVKKEPEKPTIPVIEEKPEPKVLKGDVNQDGQINVIDVGTIVRDILGKKPLNEKQRKIADINDDGKINIVDVGKIVRHILGKELIK